MDTLCVLIPLDTMVLIAFPTGYAGCAAPQCLYSYMPLDPGMLPKGVGCHMGYLQPYPTV